MTPFETSIINIYGDQGKEWLFHLPKIVEEVSLKWNLSDFKPVENLSYNYVLSGMQGNQHIILKLGLDIGGLSREVSALKAFAGLRVVKILAEQPGALLLERAMPGISLKSYFPERDDEAIQMACQVMHQLHQAPIPSTHTFPHIRDWLEVIDKDWDIPDLYLKKARLLRNDLLETSAPAVLLHGDLHHDNILQQGKAWVAIDPKGIIGEEAYEVAAFIRNPMPELLDFPNAINIITNRIDQFAKYLELDPTRITQWCFVQSVLAWVWATEDNADPDYFKRFTAIFDESLNLQPDP